MNTITSGILKHIGHLAAIFALVIPSSTVVVNIKSMHTKFAIRLCPPTSLLIAVMLGFVVIVVSRQIHWSCSGFNPKLFTLCAASVMDFREQLLTIGHWTLVVAKREPIEQANEAECVFAVENGKAKLIVVKPGIQDNSYIEIKTGLKSGQEIIAAPYSAISKTLKDGDPVEVVKKDKLYAKEKK